MVKSGKMRDKVKIEDRPDKGRKGVNGLGPKCSLVIDPKPKNKKKGKNYFCAVCAAEIKGDRKVVTMILNNWITDEGRFMSGGRFATTVSLCGNPECQQKLKDNVGDGKKFQIREWAQYMMGISKEKGYVEKGWEFDYLKSAENEGIDPQEAVEKALELVSRDRNIPAAHKKMFFEHHGRDSSEIKTIKNKKEAMRGWSLSDIETILDDPEMVTALLQGLAKRQTK